ncbi:hypothetical protein [Candidatus Amarolinea dominans]|uniref:hypothetical protein n=1 Tax=Candidatus Amarolinea dominans TaxID=3140696 RepID=UPI0031CCD719
MIKPRFIERIVPVSSTQAAEMVKLLENTFRAVNIALVNEIAVMCDKLGLDPWEVIEAAATKPYGFMKFTPGPGVGGHCIPLDPFYLSWKMKTLNYNARFIQLAGEINSDMPRYWVAKVVDALNEAGKPLKGSKCWWGWRIRRTLTTCTSRRAGRDRVVAPEGRGCALP